MAGAAEVGETYDLTGPDAPTLEESAARAGELLGTSFTYLHEEEPTDVGPEWKAGIRARGSRAIALGELDLVGDGVRRLTGAEAESVDAYVLANPAPATAAVAGRRYGRVQAGRGGPSVARRTMTGGSTIRSGGRSGSTIDSSTVSTAICARRRRSWRTVVSW